MIKLIVIIIIIFFLYKIIIKENFQTFQFVNDYDCNFYPYGNDLYDCNTKCIKFGYSNDDKYSKCNQTNCEEKCNKCSNKKLCPWTINKPYSALDNNGTNERIIKSINLYEEKERKENSQIKLKWTANLESIPEKYLIYYKNETNKALNVYEYTKPIETLTTTSTLTTTASSIPTNTEESTSEQSVGNVKIDEEINFDIVELNNYQFNEKNLIKNNIYKFIIYGINNTNNIQKSDEILVYT
jgi:hypothetical protein